MALTGKNAVHRFAPFACALLLGAIAFSGTIDAREIPGAEAYHERVRAAATAIPYRVGPWVGVDVDTTKEAVKLLKPNIIVQRLYRDPSTGRSFTMTGMLTVLSRLIVPPWKKS